MINDLIIKANGDFLTTKPKGATHYTLVELQDIVGGFVELAAVGDRHLMVMNEEGKFKDLPYNLIATQFLQQQMDYVVGDVLLCEKGRIK